MARDEGLVLNAYSGLSTWLALAIPSITILLASSQFGDLFRYERELIAGGEYWRIITGHLDHLNWSHLLLNLVFLALCIFLLAPLRRLTWTLSMWAVSAASISVSLMSFSPSIEWYVGLSGSLYALLTLGVILDSRLGLSMRCIIVAFIFSKVIGELFLPESLSSDWIGGRVVVESHLYGVMVGALLGALNALRYRWSMR